MDLLNSNIQQNNPCWSLAEKEGSFMPSNNKPYLLHATWEEEKDQNWFSLFFYIETLQQYASLIIPFACHVYAWKSSFTLKT